MNENVNHKILSELAGVISEVLDVALDEVGIDAEIYKTLNWDSLGHLSIIEKVESTYSIRIPDDLLAELTSIRRLEAFIRDSLGDENGE